SQFFVCLQNVGLPKNYTIFGEVTAGMDVVDKIAAVETKANRSGEQSTPVQTVKVTKVTISETSAAVRKSVLRFMRIASQVASYSRSSLIQCCSRRVTSEPDWRASEILRSPSSSRRTRESRSLARVAGIEVRAEEVMGLSEIAVVDRQS